MVPLNQNKRYWPWTYAQLRWNRFVANCSDIVSVIGRDARFHLSHYAVQLWQVWDQDEACPVRDDFHLGHRGTSSRRPHTETETGQVAGGSSLIRLTMTSLSVCLRSAFSPLLAATWRWKSAAGLRRWTDGGTDERRRTVREIEDGQRCEMPSTTWRHHGRSDMAQNWTSWSTQRSAACVYHCNTMV